MAELRRPAAVTADDEAKVLGRFRNRCRYGWRLERDLTDRERRMLERADPGDPILLEWLEREAAVPDEPEIDYGDDLPRLHQHRRHFARHALWDLETLERVRRGVPLPPPTRWKPGEKSPAEVARLMNAVNVWYEQRGLAR